MDAVAGGGERRRRMRPPAPLEVAPATTPPAAFRCPISLEVMRSPVSLPTGATYDRSSIQRWLDSGHRTCPATSLPLASTDLVPNLLLRRLIHLHTAALPPSPSPEEAVSQLAEAGEPDAAKNAVRALAAKLAPEKGKEASVAAALAADLDSAVPALLAVARGCGGAEARADARSILALVAPELVIYIAGDGEKQPGRAQMAIEALAAVLTADGSGDKTRDGVISALLTAGLDRVVPALLAAGDGGVRVLEAILTSPVPDADSKIAIADKPELFPELVRVLREEASPAALRCMAAALGASRRRARAAMVRAGAVPLLALAVAAAPTAAAEAALGLIAEAARCGEGKAAIAGEAAAVAAAVMGRLTRVGAAGREAAVAALWLLCCGAGGERRVREAVALAPEAVGKLLVVMQGGGSPAAARMAGELLRVVRMEQEKKGLAAAYDSRTIHVMPY